MRSLSLALATCMIASYAQPSFAQDRDAPVAPTNSGQVRGVINGDVEGFLGIPYAAPPVGDLRWRAPQPVRSWTDVRDASKFGPYCAAAKSTNGPRSESEDCLFINVWRPTKTSRDAKLPVFVFIHGGGFINGSSNQADMTEIVEKTGVVGVSFNYRLGALGFFSHPAITQDSGDFGLMDQQAALRWVHDEHRRIWRRSDARDYWGRVGGRIFGLRPSDRAWFGRPLFSGDNAKRLLHQHTSC